MNVSLEQLRRCSVAVDLGAARTRVYLKRYGIVVDAPSAVAVNVHSGALIAVGVPAERMVGRTPGHIRVFRPVSGGIVVDVDMARRMLRALVGDRLRRAWRYNMRLRAAVCVPHDCEPVARRAAVETLTGVGARRVELVDSLIAAGIGCGLPVEQPEATMIVLCGATTSHVAVLSLGAVVAAETAQVGGDVIDRTVTQHLRNQHELVLPGEDVRALHRTLCDLPPDHGEVEVNGRDAVTGLARSVRIDTENLRVAVHTPVTMLLDAIRGVLRQCPPDLVADLVDRGIVLAGGSAQLPGLDAVLRQSTGLPVTVAESPAVCAVEGLGALMEGRVRPLRYDPLTR